MNIFSPQKGSGQWPGWIIAVTLKCVVMYFWKIMFLGSFQQLEGADSRKRSVEAGLIETVLKLVDGPEPIQVSTLK